MKNWTITLDTDPKYDVTNIIDPIIPPLKKPADFFKWWSKLCPSMLRKDKLLFPPSKKFAERLEEHLNRFTRIYSGDDVVIPTVLIGSRFGQTGEDDEEVQLNAFTLPVYLLSKRNNDPSVVNQITNKMKHLSLTITRREARYILYKTQKRWKKQFLIWIFGYVLSEIRW